MKSKNEERQLNATIDMFFSNNRGKPIRKKEHLNPPSFYYDNLNDVFESGNAEIWYFKDEIWIFYGYRIDGRNFKDIQFEKPEAYNELQHSHVKLGCVNMQDEEVIFQKLQGFYWSPNGEARHFIQKLGLTHTSMSMGDIVYFRDENRARIVEAEGFSTLFTEDEKIKKTITGGRS